MKKYLGILLGALLMLGCQKKNEEGNSPSNALFDYPKYFGNPDLPGNITNKQVELGRHLFYEPILSKDSSISCASCHIQAFGFADTARFSLGVNGAKSHRNSMALANMLWQREFFWDGNAASLEEQVLFPIENEVEMNLPLSEAIARLKGSAKYTQLFREAFGENSINSNNLAIAIAHFERTLISKSSKYDHYKQGKGSLTAQEARGEVLFFTHPESSINLRGGNCGDCHAGPLTQSTDFRNNGLDETFTDEGRKEVTGNAHDMAKFKTMSLRNIELTTPYMHDGRFNTLEEVLDHYNEHIQTRPGVDPLITEASNDCINCSLGLTQQEKEDIIAFLKTLTDYEFISNKNLTNPNN